MKNNRLETGHDTWKSGVICIALLLVLSVASCKRGQQGESSQGRSEAQTESQADTKDDKRPDGVKWLMKAYPEQVKDFKDGYIVMVSGDKILYDDKKDKSYLEKLNNSDLEDMFALPYNMKASRPGYREDGGRVRNDRFLQSMYGTNESQVRANCVSVPWFGQRVQFTKVNGAADSLRKVQKELATALPQFRDYYVTSGTLYWRNIAGTNRVSAHSYGMTIDIAVQKYSNYWQWDGSNAGKGEGDELKVYNNRIPLEIVRVFEKHGFIWGGRWYHYDTMHFEFRPEILLMARDNTK